MSLQILKRIRHFPSRFRHLNHTALKATGVTTVVAAASSTITFGAVPQFIVPYEFDFVVRNKTTGAELRVQVPQFTGNADTPTTFATAVAAQIAAQALLNATSALGVVTVTPAAGYDILSISVKVL
jgi:hypothetical protein